MLLKEESGCMSNTIMPQSISIHYNMALNKHMVTAVAQWLRCCATNRKVAGSIPDGVIGIFH